jgi:formate hydrogenlyase subunit 6/NADH:ubiquinone oxidoreductase subunit I
VPDEFWAEIGDRCIACTGCNLACPSCTCFGVQDWRYTKQVERSRMWDSCQLDGFMREASGHNPLGTEALRTRRRIHHKLAADPERWGEISCFVCGRCDAVCPTGIGIFAVAREMVARYGGNDGGE